MGVVAATWQGYGSDTTPLGLGSVALILPFNRAPGHLLTVVILLYFPRSECSYRSPKMGTFGRDNGPMAGEERKYHFIRDPDHPCIFLTKIVCYVHGSSHTMESATPLNA